MAVIYFHSAFEKLRVTEWVNGTAVYFFISNNQFGPIPAIRNLLVSLLSNPFIAILFDWGTLLIEILLFAALFMSKANKKRMLIAGLLLHFGIIFLHGLMSFFFAMAGGLILFLFSIDENISLKTQIDLRKS